MLIYFPNGGSHIFSSKEQFDYSILPVHDFAAIFKISVLVKFFDDYLDDRSIEIS